MVKKSEKRGLGGCGKEGSSRRRGDFSPKEGGDSEFIIGNLGEERVTRGKGGF